MMYKCGLRRNFTHGALAERRDGQRRIDARIGGDHGTVTDHHILVAEYEVVLVNNAS